MFDCFTGLMTDSSCQVIVMGATNRPQDVDRAILRRMPSTFHVGLPVSFTMLELNIPFIHVVSFWASSPNSFALV